MTRARLDWWLGRSPELGGLIKAWQTQPFECKTAPDDGEWLNPPSRDDIRADLRRRLGALIPLPATPSETQIPIDLRAISSILTARREDRADWPFILDPGAKSPGTPGQGTAVEAVQARLARSYFLFVHALAPCLPVAIHAEIASLLYSQNHDKSPNLASVHEVLRDWRARVSGFLAFMWEYRAVFEFAKLRLDLWQHVRDVTGEGEELQHMKEKFELATEAGAHLSLAPDISFASLGVFGCPAWGLKPEGKKRGVQDPALTSGASLLSDATQNLIETLNFIAMLERMLLGPTKRARTSRAKAPSKTRAEAKAKAKASKAPVKRRRK